MKLFNWGEFRKAYSGKGGLISEGFIPGQKNAFHSSADQNTFCIYSLFQASNRRKNPNLFQCKPQGAYGWMFFLFFCLQVNGPITWGGGGG